MSSPPTSPHPRRSQDGGFSLDARPAHADAGADGLAIGPSALRDPLATREKKKVVELSVECRIHPRDPDVEILERPPRVCGEGVPKRRRSCFDREAPLTRKPCSLLPLQAASGASQTSSNLTSPTSPARFATFETFAHGRGPSTRRRTMPLRDCRKNLLSPGRSL